MVPQERFGSHNAIHVQGPDVVCRRVEDAPAFSVTEPMICVDRRHAARSGVEETAG